MVRSNCIDILVSNVHELSKKLYLLDTLMMNTNPSSLKRLCMTSTCGCTEDKQGNVWKSK